MISLLIPFHGGNIKNVQRTTESCQSLHDEIVVVSTCLFKDDLELLLAVTNKVVELPWNYCYLHGFSAMHNAGAAMATNDWLIRLDVSETIRSHYHDILEMLRSAGVYDVFLCDHINDPTHWKRVWNRLGSRWSGIIHETLSGDGMCLLFEMRDTPKFSTGDLFRDEVLRWQKATLYHVLHHRLREYPEMLGGADKGWLRFLEDHRTEMDQFINENIDLIDACTAGDLEEFKALVRQRLSAGKLAYGVNFKPTGTWHAQ